MITWEKKKGKYIICKDGVHFSLTEEQVPLMVGVMSQIHYDATGRALLIDASVELVEEYRKDLKEGR